MKTVRESTTLYNFLGSHNPYWRLTESSDVLRFSTTEPQNLIVLCSYLPNRLLASGNDGHHLQPDDESDRR